MSSLDESIKVYTIEHGDEPSPLNLKSAIGFEFHEVCALDPLETKTPKNITRRRNIDLGVVTIKKVKFNQI
jgi:hypothetical protein